MRGGYRPGSGKKKGKTRQYSIRLQEDEAVKFISAFGNLTNAIKAVKVPIEKLGN